MTTNYNWLVFGLIHADTLEEQTFRVRDHCTIIYGLGDRAVAMRFGCPYRIRVEGYGWGMMLSMEPTGAIERCSRGDKEIAGRDLFLLRLVLPKHP